MKSQFTKRKKTNTSQTFNILLLRKKAWYVNEISAQQSQQTTVTTATRNTRN